MKLITIQILLFLLNMINHSADIIFCICYRNPDGAKNYTFLQCQSRVQRMRQCRRPQSVDTIEELANILSLDQNKSYASTLQRPPSK